VLCKRTASGQRNFRTGCQTAASSCQDWQLDDVIVFLSEMSELNIENY